MRFVQDGFARTFTRKHWRMSGVSRDAPLGVQFIQKLSNSWCPRLQINRLRWYQASVLVLTFFTYMTYHLTRKPISVVKSVLHQNCSALVPPPGTDPGDDQWCNWAPFMVKSVLHQNCSALVPPPGTDPGDDQWCNWAPFNTADANTLLGTLDSAFLFSYAAAMFVSGMVAERVDLRYFLSLGMLTSAIFCYLFGVGRTYSIHNISYYLLVQAGAGIAQTTGWPGTVAIVGKWFGNSKKGLIFGIWNSHTSLGNILGTIMAAEYVDSDWSLSFIYPALVMGCVGAVVWLFLPPEPRLVGLASAVNNSRNSPARQSSRSDEEDDVEDDEESSVIVGDQSASLRPNRHSANTAQPEELVSYTFLYWLPSYIRFTMADLSARQSGELSTVFDVGGVIGAVLAGLVADCTACPALVCVAFYSLCAPMLFIYQYFGATSYLVNVALLVMTGMLVNGPYALITTAVSAELGTHTSLAGNSRALATVTAIIDGTGSVGAAIGPMLAGVVSSRSWTNVFYMLIACNFMALFLLLRSWTNVFYMLIACNFMALFLLLRSWTNVFYMLIACNFMALFLLLRSWTNVFYMLIACNFMALFLLLRIARSEFLKLKQERRMASPPRTLNAGGHRLTGVHRSLPAAAALPRRCIRGPVHLIIRVRSCRSRAAAAAAPLPAKFEAEA
ncbi:hypothetical protein B5X24_HaOG204803 [Helicoverpa armigera]|uniref:Major facilitator superfamily (MFS) profile domain-containing protein n=1 Tax=Helicoverpa armigera TaxID=29058 RepID=A0A2W1BPS8_HELAM|nr:hypothetical protein B5X24_HaOG204803 [Helicoverpa armigera]